MQNRYATFSLTIASTAAIAAFVFIGTGLIRTATEYAENLFAVATPDRDPAFVLPDGLPVDLGRVRGTIHLERPLDCLPKGRGSVALLTGPPEQPCQVIEVSHLEANVSVHLIDGTSETLAITLDKDSGLSLRHADAAVTTDPND